MNQIRKWWRTKLAYYLDRRLPACWSSLVDYMLPFWGDEGLENVDWNARSCRLDSLYDPSVGESARWTDHRVAPDACDGVTCYCGKYVCGRWHREQPEDVGERSRWLAWLVRLRFGVVIDWPADVYEERRSESVDLPEALL